ncbi:unnamed protein product [Cyprideis torosa]|uniref:Uncharacterized protein n=1 Tax=Cyprideis torosa TaxID=163714 RepID=A0A7R8ZI14_9CRUS|nr:unnamed protein product [Cyprideis torosa]CAG0885038.1 unnamed protein product [Cyprideis torosa]
MSTENSDIDLYAEGLGEDTKVEKTEDTDTAGGDTIDLYDDVIVPEPDPVQVKEEPVAKPASSNVSSEDPSPSHVNGESRTPRLSVGSDRSLGGRDSSRDRGQDQRTGRNKLLIGNLTWWTTDRDIEQRLKEIGVTDINEIKFFEHRGNGQSKGYCLVAFESEGSYRKTLDLFAKKQLYSQTPDAVAFTKQNMYRFENMNQPPGGGGGPGGNLNGPPHGMGYPGMGGGPPHYNMGGPRGPPPHMRDMRGGPPQQHHGGPRQGGMQMRSHHGGGPQQGPPPGGDRGGMPHHMGGSHMNIPPPRGGLPTSMPMMSVTASVPPPSMSMYGQQRTMQGHPPPTAMPPGGIPGLPPPTLSRPPPSIPPPSLPPTNIPPPSLPTQLNPYLPQHSQAQTQQQRPPPVSYPGQQLPPPTQGVTSVPPPAVPPHFNPAFLSGNPPPTAYPPPMAPAVSVAPTSMAMSVTSAPPPVQPAVPSRPVATAYDVSPQEFDEIMSRNKTVSSSAIARAVADASAGEIHSAQETLLTAISLIKQSKVAGDDRCKILINTLQDTLSGMESKNYGSSRSRSRDERSRSRERERHRERERRGERRERERSRSPRDYRDYYRERERERERSPSWERDRRERDRYYEEQRYRDREVRSDSTSRATSGMVRERERSSRDLQLSDQRDKYVDPRDVRDVRDAMSRSSRH